MCFFAFPLSSHRLYCVGRESHPEGLEPSVQKGIHFHIFFVPKSCTPPYTPPSTSGQNGVGGCVSFPLFFFSLFYFFSKKQPNRPPSLSLYRLPHFLTSLTPTSMSGTPIFSFSPFPQSTMSNSLWSDAQMMPADPVFGLVAEYKKDSCPDKIDLVVGAYRDENGKPYLLPSISEAEIRVANLKLDKEYLPIDGLKEFRDAAAVLALGDTSPSIQEKRVMTVQTLSGTGALRLVGGLYKQLGVSGKCYVSNPTWANHKGIFQDAGFEVATYRYWDAATKTLDFAGYTEDLRSIADGSIVVLHLCAHNPTGVDATEEQWHEVAAICKTKGHRVIFDSAYQGYCTGDLEGDAFAARLFEKEGMEFAITQSYSKNMGLYGERVGCLIQVCESEGVAASVLSNAKQLARVYYSNPPKHGARTATLVLNDPVLRPQWEKELKAMSVRISEMRRLLRSEIEKLNTPGDWSHITTQRGMFSFTGVSKTAVDHIVKNHHVYMLGSGRISIAGITKGNVAYVARAFHDGIMASRAGL